MEGMNTLIYNRISIVNGYITSWTCVQPKHVHVTVTIALPTYISHATDSVNSMYSTINDVHMSQLSSTDIIGGIDGGPSPGSETGSHSMIYVISGVIGALLTIVVIVIMMVALLVMCKRLDPGSEIATCHQPQAVMKDYQEVPIGTVAIDTSIDDVISEVMKY